MPPSTPFSVRRSRRGPPRRWRVGGRCVTTMSSVSTFFIATTPKSVAAVEAANFAEWRRSFAVGLRGARMPRRAGQPRFVVERVQVVGWMSLVPGGGGRPHTLGLMAAGQPAELWPALVQRSLAFVAQHHPGAVWCSLRHYD